MRYRIHGLTIASEIALPDARPYSRERHDDVRITCAPPRRCERQEVALEGDADRATLFLPAVATFEFQRGESIRVIPHVADVETLRTFLLGSAWAVLLHQRNMLPLHGCAVEFDAKVCVFVGRSGAGKSTLAAALLASGARLVSDDVTAITLAPEGAFVWPGLRSQKRVLGEREPDLGTVLGYTHDGLKERVVPARLAADRRSRLTAIIELAELGASDVTLHRLGGARGCGVALRHTFRGATVPLLGLAPRHLAACALLAGSTRIFRLERPWDAEAVAATADWLMAQDLQTADAFKVAASA